MDSVFREIKQQVTFFSTKQLDFPAHIHEDIELIYVKKGRGTVYCDGKKYTLSENSFFFVFPNQVHQYIGCSGEYILLIIKPSMLLSNRDVYMTGHPTEALKCFSNSDDDNTAMLLKMALSEYERDGYSSVIAAYLTTFFEKLIKFYNIEKEKVSSDTVLRILQYCAAHYKEDITVTSIADDLQISKSSVSHIFSSRLAMSFSDHINALRLNDAMNLLKGKNYSITEIAALSGFATIRTFNRVFRKQYGISPSDYRKRLHKQVSAGWITTDHITAGIAS